MLESHAGSFHLNSAPRQAFDARAATLCCDSERIKSSAFSRLVRSHERPAVVRKGLLSGVAGRIVSGR